MNSRLTNSSLPQLSPRVGFASLEAGKEGRIESLQAAAEYCKRELAGAAALRLPADRLRPSATGTRYAERSLCVGPELGGLLRGFGETVSLSWTLLGAFCGLLVRYTGEEDLAIACSLADLAANGSKPTGKEFFLRVDLSGDPSLRTIVQRIDADAQEAISRTPCSLAELAQTLRGSLDAIQVSFAYGDNASASLPADLHLQVAETDFQLRIRYDAQLFEASTIDRMLNHYQILLQGMLENPQDPLSRLPILTEAEKKQALVDWNQTAVDTPKKCLHELIEEQVKFWPGRIAVVSDDRKLTYREFNTRANQLAHELRSRGAKPGERVGICLDHSSAFAISVLAVLKSGAACVPLDADYPKDRIAYMLEDVKARVLLTFRKDASGIDSCELRSVDDRGWAGGGERNLVVSDDPQSRKRRHHQ